MAALVRRGRGARRDPDMVPRSVVPGGPGQPDGPGAGGGALERGARAAGRHRAPAADRRSRPRWPSPGANSTPTPEAAGLAGGRPRVGVWWPIGIAGATFAGRAAACGPGRTRELDADAGLGLSSFRAYVEDVWVLSAFLFLVLFPLLALFLALAAVATLVLVRGAVRAREERRRVPCAGCSRPMHAHALVCPACGRTVEQPHAVGLFGQSVERLAPDRERHAFRLIFRHRCPACAARLTTRDPYQVCAECGRCSIRVAGGLRRLPATRRRAPAAHAAGRHRPRRRAAGRPGAGAALRTPGPDRRRALLGLGAGALEGALVERLRHVLVLFLQPVPVIGPWRCRSCAPGPIAHGGARDGTEPEQNPSVAAGVRRAKSVGGAGGLCGAATFSLRHRRILLWLRTYSSTGSASPSSSRSRRTRAERPELDARLGRGAQRPAVGRVDLVGGREAAHVGAADEEQLRRALARRDHARELLQVLAAALGDRVGEARRAALDQGGALDLDVAARPSGSRGNRSMRLFSPYLTSRRRPS